MGPDGGGGGHYIDTQLARAAKGEMAPYAQIAVSSRRAVGVTSYLTPRFWPGRTELCAVEIGSTWLAASAQGSGINPEAKLLLFRHAFAEWGVVRAQHALARRDRGARCTVRGRPAQLAAVVGAG